MDRLNQAFYSDFTKPNRNRRLFPYFNSPREAKTGAVDEILFPNADREKSLSTL